MKKEFSMVIALIIAPILLFKNFSFVDADVRARYCIIDGSVNISGSFYNDSSENSVSFTNADVQYTDNETVRKVQEAISEAGYVCTVDGEYGPNTAGQISAYERDHGLTEDGIITDELLKALQIEVSEEAKEKAEKESYSTEYSWEQLARNPSDYRGVKVKFSGRIEQADPSDSSFGTRWTRMAANDNLDTVFYLIIPASQLSGRLLEGDHVTIYCTGYGTETYTAVLGNSITIPKINVDYLEMNN